jgi:RNA-directed DNA polymerase
LNELDYFVKHQLKIKYYIRYVDDFIILHKLENQLEVWLDDVGEFLGIGLKIELHPQKTRIISLSRGIDFVRFRNFYYFRLLRKRNLKNIRNKIKKFNNEEIDAKKINKIWQGWSAYAIWADGYNSRKKLIQNLFSFYAIPNLAKTSLGFL